VCRRRRPKPEQIEKPKRKRRRDAKWKDHAERQRKYQAIHSIAGIPEGIRALLSMKAKRSGIVATRVREPA